MRKIAFFVLMLSLLVGACAKKTPDSGIMTEKDTMPSCENPYIVLPGNYIIDLAAGSEVYLNPDIQNFALFCDADEARRTLENDLEAGRIRRESDWRLYRVQGNMGEIGRNCGHNQICLDQQTRIIEWLENK